MQEQRCSAITISHVEEASRALAEFGDKAKLYAGGAELLLLLRNGLLDAEILIDVKKIERLRLGNFRQWTCCTSVLA